MQPRTYSRILLFTLFFVLGLLLAPKAHAQTWYKKGLDEKDNNLKVEYFTRAIKEERQDRWVYYMRAWAYFDLNKYEKSIRDFTTAKKAEGNLADTHLEAGLAWCHYTLEDHKKGLEYADKAVELLASNAEGWNIKGWCHLRLDQNEKSVAAFTKYISLNPDVYIGYSNRSYAYTRTKQFQKVIVDCDKALSFKPGVEFLIERKAFAMMKLGQKQEAIDLVQEKIEYKPNDPLSLSKIGDLFYRNEDYDAAIEYHTDAIALYNHKIRQDKEFKRTFRDNIYEIYLSRGDAHYAKVDYQRALADYKMASSLKEEDYRAWYKIGNLQTYQKNWSEGAQGYERAFALNPELKFGWVNLGYCYDNLKRTDRAINAYTRGIKNNPEVGLLYNNRGYGYLELKQYDKALADLKKAIEVEPEVVMSHVSLGEYYYDVKEYDKAIQKFNESIAMDEGSDQAYSAAYYTRGMCYFDQEQYAPAKKDFKSAIKITPDHVLAHEKLGIAHFHSGENCASYKMLKKTLNLEKMVPAARKQAKDAPRFLGKMTRNPCQ